MDLQYFDQKWISSVLLSFKTSMFCLHHDRMSAIQASIFLRADSRERSSGGKVMNS